MVIYVDALRAIFHMEYFDLLILKPYGLLVIYIYALLAKIQLNFRIISSPES